MDERQKMKTFKQKVYEIAATIPKGKVMTYSQLAALAGNPKAARAVGMLMAKNPDLRKVPCHRVVSAKGELTGYSNGGIKIKKEMLAGEGVLFNGDAVVLSKSKWKSSR